MKTIVYKANNMEAGQVSEIVSLCQDITKQDHMVLCEFAQVDTDVPAGDTTNGFGWQLVVITKTADKMGTYKQSESAATLMNLLDGFECQEFNTYINNFPQVYGEGHTMHEYFAG